jgi:hypothetical protein
VKTKQARGMEISRWIDAALTGIRGTFLLHSAEGRE